MTIATQKFCDRRESARRDWHLPIPKGYRGANELSAAHGSRSRAREPAREL
jgi:hypothetical protein